MNDTSMLFTYTKWVLIVGLVILLFNYFVKKNRNIGVLLLQVMLPAWLILAIIEGFEMLLKEDATLLFSIKGIVLLLARTLPMIVVVGGITFAAKYIKAIKKNPK